METLLGTQTTLLKNRLFAICTLAVAAMLFVVAYLFINVSRSLAVDCTVPKSGTLTVSSTCSIPTNGLVNGSTTVKVLGADGSGINITSGSMTINPGVTLVWGPGSSITRSASTTLFNATGAQVTQKYVCFYDPDGDLAANDYATTTQGGTAVLQASSSCSANYRRQNTLNGAFTNMNTVVYDQSPSDAACYNQTPCYSTFYPAFYPAFYPSFYPAFYPYQTFYPAFYPAFYPGFYPAFYPYQTFYPAFYPYQTFYPAFYPYQSFYPGFYPSFYPGFYPGFYPYQSFYPGFYPAAYGGFYPGFYPYQAFAPCFVNGTQILMANGTTKNIEDVKSGDKVMSFDFGSGKLVTNEVVETYVHPENDSYLLINGGTGVTGNHRLWTNNSEWKRADQLILGDNLQDKNGDNITVASIENVTKTGQVYNLHLLSENHNYFADGILAHNGKQ